MLRKSFVAGFIGLTVLLLNGRTTFADYTSCAASTTSQVYQNWCWQYNVGPIAWDQAMSACIADGGTLANLYSQDQWIALVAYINKFSANLAWVALTSAGCSCSPSQMKWASGPNATNDVTTVTVGKQVLLGQQVGISTNFSINVGNCALWQSCGSVCCWYTQGGTSGYQLVPAPSDLTYCGFIPTYPYVCEYINCQRSGNFRFGPYYGSLTYGSTVYLASTTATNSTDCLNKCLSTKFCVSFDYTTASSLCVLWPTTLYQVVNSTGFTYTSGVQHFDMTGTNLP